MSAQVSITIGLSVEGTAGSNYRTAISYTGNSAPDSVAATAKLNPATIGVGSSAAITVLPDLELNGVPITDPENAALTMGQLDTLLVHVEAAAGAATSVLELMITGLLCPVASTFSTARVHLTVSGGRRNATFLIDSPIVPAATGTSLVITHLSGPTDYKISLRMVGS